MSRSPAVRPNLVVLVLALGGIVVSLMQTLVVPLIPRLPALLHASAADSTWVITARHLQCSTSSPRCVAVSAGACPSWLGG